ncbi:MAG TPA: glycosyltransferase family 4 protein [Chthoniobacterales bacterium]
MKILFFAHETTLSGAPIQLFHLVNWLKRKGWQVSVAIPKAEAAESGPLSSRLAQAGVSTFPILDLSVPPAMEELRHLCARFDLVVANTLVMWAAVRAAHEAGVPAVWYIHESLVAEQLIAAIPEIQSALELADCLVLPTPRTAEIYARRIDRPITVIPYGIPVPNAPPGLTTSSIREREFLLLGSYEPRKGQDLFLRAIEELDDSVRQRARFFLAGRVLDRTFHEALLREAAEMPNVEVRAALDHGEALQAIARADVLVCASRDETMPVAILEAMGLGKMIISTRVGGVTEWLSDESNALLVPSNDSRALAMALRRTVENGELVESLGKNAHQTFLAYFSIDQLGRSFVALFREMAPHQRNP